MTLKINKVGISCYDNKRYIIDDNINTLAWTLQNKTKLI